MATFFTHAALPFIAVRGLGVAPAVARRLAVTGAVCACLPDLDLSGALFEIQTRDAWGHRGLTHSLLFALAVTLGVMAAAPPVPRRRALGWLWVFGCAASHGLLDAMTHGEGGVALFAPFWSGRVLLPFAPIAVSPLGVNEAFGRMGALVLFNEILAVWVPVGLIAAAVRPDWKEYRPRLVVAAAAWAAVCVALGLSLPGFFASRPRVLEAPTRTAAEPAFAWLAEAGEPDAGLLTEWDAFADAGLLDAVLTAPKPLWSSTFFPWWYGGEAGRWQDGRARLIARTLTGFTPDTQEQLRRTLDDAKRGNPEAAAYLLRLSPTEKFDLAVGALGLPATRQALRATHNGSPRFWFGLCNGVAAAAMNEPEPYRVVDALSPEGDTIRFLPTDIKALLAASYFWMTSVTGPRNSCRYVGLDSGRLCSMNPVTAVVTTLNRLGRAHETFLVDVVPALQSQFYAVAAATVRVIRPPYAYDGTPAAADVRDRITRLVDVELDYTMSSTTLGYAVGNRPTPADVTRYERVGLAPVRFSWPATLAIDSDGQLIAGRWTGQPADGPDTLFVLAGGPLLAEPDAGFAEGALEFNPSLRWPVIARLAHASVDPSPGVPRVDLSQPMDAAENKEE